MGIHTIRCYTLTCDGCRDDNDHGDFIPHYARPEDIDEAAIDADYHEMLDGRWLCGTCFMASTDPCAKPDHGERCTDRYRCGFINDEPHFACGCERREGWAHEHGT